MSWARYANWTVKVLLVLFLLVGFLFPDLPRFEGKAWPLRAMTYPLAALVVPVVWLIKRPDLKYPHLADALLALPFVVDLAGNAANLFDTLTYTDDALHFLNWFFLVAAVSVFVAPLGFPRWNRIILGVGVGSFAIVCWEAVEYLLMLSGATGLHLSYADTMGDLVLSTAGGAVGAIAVALLRVGEPTRLKRA